VIDEETDLAGALPGEGGSFLLPDRNKMNGPPPLPSLPSSRDVLAEKQAFPFRRRQEKIVRLTLSQDLTLSLDPRVGYPHLTGFSRGRGSSLRKAKRRASSPAGVAQELREVSFCKPLHEEEGLFNRTINQPEPEGTLYVNPFCQGKGDHPIPLEGESRVPLTSPPQVEVDWLNRDL